MKYILLIVLISLSICTRAQLIGPKSVILKHGQPREKYYHFASHAKPASLSIAELLKIDELINKQILIHNKTLGKNNPVKNKAQNYYKQLVAVTNATGQKQVLVICFCSVDKLSDWKKQLIIVGDGNTCYFDLKINLTTNSVYEFNVNGNG